MSTSKPATARRPRSRCCRFPSSPAWGSVEDRALLPSFLYLPHADELAPGELGLPWVAAQDYAVGEFARSRGAATPIRLVASAKSWLCHPGVDRRADILPAEAPAEVARISPLTASVRYLSHLRAAWNAAHPDSPFDAQDITVTIPASFDPAARELTAEAAQAASYPHITLLEEPQAALYSWIQRSAGQWRKDVKRGDLILVVDVGGGTTDLSLIAVLERDGNLELHRVAVGEHILLGGDNMDLALAYAVARKLAGAGHAARPVADTRARPRLPCSQGSAVERPSARAPCRWWCRAAARS
jgi:molecular chaperone DnaK (HSP70)